jgi:AraC-like DNA-binding protein
MGSSPNTRILRIVATTLLVAGMALWGLAPDRCLDLLPRVQRVVGISDRFQGGGSSIHPSVSEGRIRFRYVLDSATRYPWAGINLRIADSSQEPLDLRSWRALRVHAAASSHAPLRIQLLSDDLAPGADVRDSTRPVYHIVEYSPSERPQELAWEAFQIPSWWRDQNRREELQRLDLLDRLRSIEFHNGFSTRRSDTATIDLISLELVGTNHAARIGAVLLVLAAVSILGWSFRSSKEVPRPVPLVPDPARVVLDDPRARQREALLVALSRSFPDPELGLESFAASQGLSPRLVSALLKEATSLHFKGALNELRLNEAARLLRETRGNISEIAFAVGFQNASHFGRAFRERFGQSPSDYRGERPPEG